MAADQPRVADLLVRCLEHEGVTCVFGIPGEENIHFTEALAADTVSVIACPVDYTENLRLTEALGELSGPF